MRAISRFGATYHVVVVIGKTGESLGCNTNAHVSTCAWYGLHALQRQAHRAHTHTHSAITALHIFWFVWSKKTTWQHSDWSGAKHTRARVNKEADRCGAAAFADKEDQATHHAHMHHGSSSKSRMVSVSSATWSSRMLAADLRNRSSAAERLLQIGW